MPPVPALPPEKENRRAGRLHAVGIWCELGVVIDVSGSGLCVAHRGGKPRQGATVRLTLECPAGVCTVVEGTIVRIRRHGFRKYEIGIAFSDMSNDDRTKLLRIVRAEQVRNSLAA